MLAVLCMDGRSLCEHGHHRRQHLSTTAGCRKHGFDVTSCTRLVTSLTSLSSKRKPRPEVRTARYHRHNGLADETAVSLIDRTGGVNNALSIPAAHTKRRSSTDRQRALVSIAFVH